jgi:hypothetical protein
MREENDYKKSLYEKGRQAAQVLKSKFQEKHKYSETFKSGSTKKTNASTIRNSDMQATVMDRTLSMSPRSDRGGIIDKLEKEMA